MKSIHATFAQDFFFELMKDSQRLRAGYLAERERWLASVAVDGREELLFQMEMLLRGIERYFNLHNLPLDERGPVVANDFTEELKSVRDAVNRCATLARALLDAPSDRRMVFRKYLESRIADDRLRRDLIEQELDQATPQESLFLIRSGFVALRGIVDAILKLPHCGYQLFSDVGQVVLREIARNKYFKPLRPLEFRGEYDRIKSVRVLEIVRGIPDLEVRRPITLAFLALFRLLHYLQYLPGPGEAPVKRAFVVAALLHSEFSALSAFLEKDIAARLEKGAPDKAQIIGHVGMSLGRESTRIARRELAQGARGASEAMARAKKAYAALCQQQVAVLAGAFEPSVAETDLFDDQAARRERAVRLRLDLCAFREACRRTQKAFASPVPADAEQAVEGIKRFVQYFRDVAYQLLRYGDYDPFDRFQTIVGELGAAPAASAQRVRVEEDFRLFAEVLERVLTAVCNREELAGVPFNEFEATAVADRFVRA